MRMDEESFKRGLAELAWRDEHLGAILSKWGNPPLWTHPLGFPGLVIAILSQQVSIESANAVYAKLEKSTGNITPDNFLALDDGQLLQVGFSRQKASYVRGIAQEITSGVLDMEVLEGMADDLVRRTLEELRGVGTWTANTYLLFALRRPDAWPSGDLALEKAVQELKGLTDKPSSDQVDKIAETWKPWRAVAARILWHYYLNQRGRAAPA